MKKQLPLGISEFSKIITEQRYYVDKTALIEDILLDGSEVILFTRPRRFGKTLNMTMLREFFDITKDNKALFQSLYIEQQESFSQINTCPTLYFSFRDCKGSKRELIQHIKLTLIKEYLKYEVLRQSLSGYEKEKYDLIFRELKNEVSTDLIYTQQGIVFLCELLQKHYHRPVMLFIDEYDTPMVEAYVNGYYEELRSFFTSLYGSALKDNPYLKKGIITGIQRIAKENIFSGLNNLQVITVNDALYHQYFGLTSEETKTLLQYYELDLTEQVTKMYNGYNFGGLQIYNPWSILKYAKNRVLRPYWINTSSNTMIRTLIRESELEFKEDFELLILEKEVRVLLDTVTSFWEMQDANTLWGLLVNAGYLTVKDPEAWGTNVVRIPNKEVQWEFQKIVSEYTKISETSLVKMFYYLVEEFNLAKFKKIYQDIILRNTSFYDAKENAYHMLFLGMCIYLDGYYELKSNIETGIGRSDIIMKSYSVSQYPNFVIEFKQGDDVKRLALDAVEQIKEKQYATGLEGHTVLMGVAHNKKECEILVEEC